MEGLQGKLAILMFYAQIVKNVCKCALSHLISSQLIQPKVKELTPNKTRRAQCANWIVFYREELFGYTVEELRERRRLKKEAEAAAEAEGDTTWKPPVKEVF